MPSHTQTTIEETADLTIATHLGDGPPVIALTDQISNNWDETATTSDGLTNVGESVNIPREVNSEQSLVGDIELAIAQIRSEAAALPSKNDIRFVKANTLVSKLPKAPKCKRLPD